MGIGTTSATQKLTVSANAIIGSDTSSTETLANTGFVMNGDDLFVAGMAGIEGNVYTDGSFIAGASTTYGNGSITQSSGETLTIGTTAANLTLSTTTSGSILLNSIGNVGIGGTAPGTAPYLFVGSTGNVGIGTTGPGYILDTQKDSDLAARFTRAPGTVTADFYGGSATRLLTTSSDVNAGVGHQFLYQDSSGTQNLLGVDGAMSNGTDINGDLVF